MVVSVGCGRASRGLMAILFHPVGGPERRRSLRGPAVPGRRSQVFCSARSASFAGAGKNLASGVGGATLDGKGRPSAGVQARSSGQCDRQTGFRRRRSVPPINRLLPKAGRGRRLPEQVEP